MSIESKRKLNNQLEQLLQGEKMKKMNEEEKANMIRLMGETMSEFLLPVLDSMDKSNQATQQAISSLNSQLDKQKEILAEGVKGITEATKNIKVNVPKVEIPEIKVPKAETPKIPQISVPKSEVVVDTINIEKTLQKGLQSLKPPIVNVPEPKVNVKVPDFPKEMDIKGWVRLQGVDLANPLPVQLRTPDGKPMQLGGSSSAGGGSGVMKTSKGNVSPSNPAPIGVYGDDGTQADVVQLPNINSLSVVTTGKSNISADDSPSIDAFGRWRVSNVETIFDSKQLHDAQPLFWDDQEVSGAATGTSHSSDTASTVISVGDTTAGRRVRQTFRRFNYQPGKSQLIFITGVMNKSGGGAGIRAGMGLYDDNNGLFLESNDGTYMFVRRTSTAGAGAVDNEVTQPNWNLDTMDGNGPSGITLDFSKAQILVIDFEWLGVGRVRMGFVVDGMIYYAHEFLNANNLAQVYMSTPNLPIRYEIENEGTGAPSSLEHICSSVMAEGGQQDIGQVRYTSTANTQVDAAVVGTVYGVKGIRLKTTALDETVKILKAAIQIQSASDDIEWMLIWNPTVAGTPTWNNETNSSVQTATGATAHTITGGTYVNGGFLSSGSAINGAGGDAFEIENALLLGSNIAGTPDAIWLAVRPLTNVNTLVEGSLTWRELS